MQNSGPEVASDRIAGNAIGDLAAELAQRSKDLARSDAIRRAVTLSATELLRSLDPNRSIPKVLGLIGASIGASRISVYENARSAEGRLAISRRYTWEAPGVAATENAHELLYADATAERSSPLFEQLATAEVQTLIARDAEPSLKRLLESQGVISTLMVPLFVDRKRWGAMKVDDCSAERRWSTIEIDTLQTVAELIGTAVAHARTLRDLADASRIIENSPAILYRLGAQNPFPLIYLSQNISHYGYSAAELLSAPTRYLELVHPNDLPDVMADIVRIAEGRITEASRERRIRAADGHYVWFEDRTRALYDEDHHLTAIEGILIDINERKTAQAQIARFELIDSLTGLANRKAFNEELEHVFAAAKRGAPGFAIHYLDLDHFKDVNDVLGHSKGDELLKLVAQRLKTLHRASDLIARFGGDEFAILQTEVSDPSDAGALAARILQDLAVPYDLGTQIHITASIGIAVFSNDTTGPEEMIKHADMALYRAKDLGRSQYHFHSEQLDIAIIERVTLAGDLHHALDRGELELYYQPQVEVQSGRIVGLEALARWHHPKHGLLYPTRFIPIAEKTGTILPLGRWLIEDVCRQIAAWRAENLVPPTVAINVSAAQLKASPEFDSELSRSLRKWGIEPGSIELELTESVLMETTREHGEVIDRLRALGVSIAIDDFGTGYSSLGYLRSYRVSHIKIAQEFIHDLQADSGDVAIVRAAISLARELGIKVIAEGVETKFQLDLLADAGCQLIQGFYFSHPVPAKQAGELLRQGVLHPAPAEDEALHHTELHARQTSSQPDRDNSEPGLRRQH